MAGRQTKRRRTNPKQSAAIITNDDKENPAIYKVGTYLVQSSRLRPHDPTDSQLYHSGQHRALLQRLDQRGFIFVRRVIDADTVSEARKLIIKHLHSKHAIAKSNTNTDNDSDLVARIARDANGATVKGWTIDADSGGINGDREPDEFTDGWKCIGTSTQLAAVYNGAQLREFYRSLFGVDAVTFPDCTWLRIRGRGDDTQEHADYYYFKQERDIFGTNWPYCHSPTDSDTDGGSGSGDDRCSECKREVDDSVSHHVQCALCRQQWHKSCLSPPLPLRSRVRGEYHCPPCADSPFPFYTCWISMGTITNRNGRLALIPETHRLTGYHSTKTKLPSQWTKAREAQSIWYSDDMSMGDLILFNMKTIHAATPNLSDEFRISIDTRCHVPRRLEDLL